MGFTRKNLWLVANLWVLVFELFSSAAGASSSAGVGIGVMHSGATSDRNGLTIDSADTVNGGVIGLLGTSDFVKLLTGFYYAPRNFLYSVGASSGTARFIHVDVPLGVLLMVSDYGGPFVAANAALNVSSSCSGGGLSCSNVPSAATGWQLGVHFKFSPDLGASLHYENMSSLMPGIDHPKAFVARLFYML